MSTGVEAATWPARWPVHPPPEPLESLSSWVERLARPYGMEVPRLLRDLGVDGLQSVRLADQLDEHPPDGLTEALADRTGVPLAQLRLTTVAGWAPMLLERWEPHRVRAPYQLQWSQATFDGYVRGNSVLLAPRRYDRASYVPYQRRRTWWGPWQNETLLTRCCPVCWTPDHPVSLLVWRLPMVSSCHGYQLVDPIIKILERYGGTEYQPVEVSAPVAQLDRYTYQGLRTGLVKLPGRTVQVGVWLRILRSMLDEVTLATAALTRGGRTTIAAIWDAIGRPYRDGLNVWTPYEHLHPVTQDTFLEAVAVAVQLVADGEITARGRHGPALRMPPHRPVPPGDPPNNPDPWAADTWQEISASFAELMARAKTERVAAHRALSFMAAGSRNRTVVEREIGWLTARGVPARFFDDHPMGPIGSDG